MNAYTYEWIAGIRVNQGAYKWEMNVQFVHVGNNFAYKFMLRCKQKRKGRLHFTSTALSDLWREVCEHPVCTDSAAYKQVIKMLSISLRAKFNPGDVCSQCIAAYDFMYFNSLNLKPVPHGLDTYRRSWCSWRICTSLIFYRRDVCTHVLQMC
jgi:hypothetical protein